MYFENTIPTNVLLWVYPLGTILVSLELYSMIVLVNLLTPVIFSIHLYLFCDCQHY